MELQYYKTDRNGTKYYYDWTCQRCGGAGASDKWCFTGRICYECGGSGKAHKPQVVKVYTPEYEAKLAARRQARLKANEPTDEQKAEMQRLHEEAKARERERLFGEYGCDKSGHGFVYIGRTFKYKDLFRNAGGKWLTFHQVWVTPTLVEVDNSIKVVEIALDELIDFKDGGYNTYRANRYLEDLR